MTLKEVKNIIPKEEIIKEQKIICSLCEKQMKECPEYDECLISTEKWLEIRRSYERK